MSSSEQLKKAYALIKAGRKEEALKLIKPILRADRGNAAGWWLLANAIDDPVRQEKALETVLKLRPGEPKATRMLAEIRQPEPVAADDPFGILDTDDDPFADTGRNDDPFDDPFASTHDDPFADDPFADGGQSSSYRPPAHTSGKVQVKKSSSSSTPLLIGGGLILIVLVLGVAAFLFIGSAGTSISTEGNCDIGQVNHVEMTTIECSTIALDSRWSGRLNAYERHDWVVSGTAGQAITIDVEGDTLHDPVVELRNEQGAQVASDDDSGTDLNARIVTSLPTAGTYFIRVSSFNDNQGGDYRITVRDQGIQVAESGGSSSSSRRAECNSSGRLASCSAISVGEQVTGYIAAGEEDGWSFRGENGQTVTIDLRGINDEDVYLELYNERGNLIAENDDISLSSGNYDSRLTLTLNSTETYTIVARTWSGFDSANYSLSLR